MANLEQHKYGGTIRKLQILRLALAVVAVALVAALVVIRIFFLPTVELTSGDDSGLSGETADNQEMQSSVSDSDPELSPDPKPSDDLEGKPFEQNKPDAPEEGEEDSSEQNQPDALEEGEEDSSEQNQPDAPEEGEEDSPEQNQPDTPEEGQTAPPGQDQTDTPKADKEDKEESKDDSSESTIQGNQNDDDTGIMLNGSLRFPERTPGGETSQSEGVGEDQEELANNSDVKGTSVAMTAFIALSILLGIDVAAIIILSIVIIKKRRMNPELHVRTERIMPDVLENTRMGTVTAQSPQRQSSANKVTVGKLHNIGARPYQEDSSGLVELNDGVLAIVADGMGGLSGGDKVSQKIVFTMLSYGESLKSGQMDGVLSKMVNGVNEAVNTMLGPSGLYKSGSTLLAVLVRQRRFHWIAVGDSHIYLYHRGCLTQLNQEHNREQDLLKKAAQGEISFEQAKNDPKKSGLTSFIGMGKLKYVDKSLVSIPVEQGDRIILMTDGVFNAVPDQEIASVLERYSDVSAAAAELERMVIRRANPKQDNFTAVILGI